MRLASLELWKRLVVMSLVARPRALHAHKERKNAQDAEPNVTLIFLKNLIYGVYVVFPSLIVVSFDFGIET